MTDIAALPLSGAITAIMVLYYGVGHWNSYFSALIYMSDQNKFPLQLVPSLPQPASEVTDIAASSSTATNFLFIITLSFSFLY